jgi:hypothetical protein
MTCPRCGRQNPEGAKFCLECGAALTAGASGGRDREERKVVSVLFADMVGFTSEAERLDPEEVRAVSSRTTRCCAGSWSATAARSRSSSATRSGHDVARR